MKRINAQKYLLDNNCDDLLLNDRPWTEVKDRIYSSDIMMQFAIEYHEAELKKLRVGDVSNSFDEQIKIEDCEYYCSDECDCVGKYCGYGK